MFAFPDQLYLAVRFFIERSGRLNMMLLKIVRIYNIICVSSNFLWQGGYLVYLHQLGELTLLNLPVFIIMFISFSWDEYVLRYP